MSCDLRGVTDKALRSELRSAVRRGWTASYTSKNHVKMVLPDSGQPPVFTPLTPSSQNTLRNVRAALRRAERQRPS